MVEQKQRPRKATRDSKGQELGFAQEVGGRETKSERVESS